MGMIRINKLTKRFEKRAVLDELTLSIEAGDRIALIGSNGAGKTTLFRCILGHYRFGGEVGFDGAGKSRRDLDMLSRVAFVPQMPPPCVCPWASCWRFRPRDQVRILARWTKLPAKWALI